MIQPRLEPLHRRNRLIPSDSLTVEERRIWNGVLWHAQTGQVIPMIKFGSRGRTWAILSNSEAAGVGVSPNFNARIQMRDYLYRCTWKEGTRKRTGLANVCVAGTCLICGKTELLSSTGHRAIEASHPTRESYERGKDGVLPSCRVCHVMSEENECAELERRNRRWLD